MAADTKPALTATEAADMIHAHRRFIFADMDARVLEALRMAEAALRAQGEPVAWLTHSRNGMVRSILIDKTPDEMLMPGDVQTPLYAAPQTGKEQ